MSGHVRFVWLASLLVALLSVPPSADAQLMESVAPNGDPIVTDASTGLIWADTPSLGDLQQNNPLYPAVSAVAWAQSLNSFHSSGAGYAGVQGWQLPSIEQLTHLFTEMGVLGYPSPFLHLNPNVDYYWSSTLGPEAGEAWLWVVLNPCVEGIGCLGGWYPGYVQLDATLGGGSGALAVSGTQSASGTTQTAANCGTPAGSGAYSAVEIPPPAGSANPPIGLALSACGDATGAFYPYGYSNSASPQPHLFLYKRGVTTDLGDDNVNQLFDNGSAGIIGYGINSSDTIAGVFGANLESAGFFTLYDGYFFPVFPSGLTPSAYTANASAINDGGLVTGSFLVLSAPSGCTGGGDHFFVYNFDQSTFTDLNSSIEAIGGCFGHGNAINDAGQIAGYYVDNGNNAYAFLYDPSTGRATNLGNLGYQFTYAYGINSVGDVTGWSYECCGKAPDAFLYKKATLIDLGNLGGQGGSIGIGGSQGNAINASDQVTGFSWAPGNVQHAFLYSNGKMVDLNTWTSANGGCLDTNPTDSANGQYAPCTLINGVAINDSGQILVQGCFNSAPNCINATTNQLVTFLLTPPAANLAATLGSTSVDASGNYIVNIVLVDTGGAPANTTTLTVASLVVVQNGKPVTIPVSALPAVQPNNLAPGGSSTLTLTFPPSAGVAGAPAALRWSANYSGGNASGTIRLALP